MAWSPVLSVMRYEIGSGSTRKPGSGVKTTFVPEIVQVPWPATVDGAGRDRERSPG